MDIIVSNDEEDEKEHAKSGACHASNRLGVGVDFNLVQVNTTQRSSLIYFLSFSTAFIGMLAYLQLRVSEGGFG